jgi:hypothetical protein
MNRRYELILAGAAMVLAATLGVTPALATATATWTIRPGSAMTARSGKATLDDTGSGNFFACKSLSASGTLKSGSELPGAAAGSISAVGFHTCTSPLGTVRPRRVNLIFTIRATDLPWHVNLSASNNGAVTGTISGVRIRVETSGCRWVLDGTSGSASDGVIGFSYTNSTGKLALLTTGGNLHVYDVLGCFGVINNGDPFTISATFTVNPRQTITSP